jgi:hypothetical protein
MNLQHERINTLRERPNLPFVSQAVGALAQQAARDLNRPGFRGGRGGSPSSEDFVP